MSKDKGRFSKKISIKNKKAQFDYEILDKFTAGMELKGTEIKSIREGKANLTDGFCVFYQNELFVRQIHISAYKQAGIHNHEPTRERKLLLKKQELKKLKKQLEEKSLTIIPLRLFINERGYAKLEIGLARGKKLHDKRESIKEKDLKKEMQRLKL